YPRGDVQNEVDLNVTPGIMFISALRLLRNCARHPLPANKAAFSQLRELTLFARALVAPV
ncbi:MAG: hypothetical protein IJ111_08725, partial [Eggerthellaceae bacterium]|nr:hypothetical protein [Eggerthellaceae bacterium]